MVVCRPYTVGELLYEGPHSLIYRATREKDQCPVVLKMFREDYPSPEQIAWFRQEYLITKSLDVDGAIQTCSLEIIQDRWTLVLEDFGGDSLDHLNIAGKLPIDDFLDLSIRISSALSEIHSRQIIHKDVNPSNILFNHKTKTVKFIDFGLSSYYLGEETEFQNIRILSGSLEYISPEQTGRTNRVVDYRSDLYSLGVTLYYLLTGTLPFEARDPMELIHSHIAREPVAPHKMNSKIPVMISKIIMKLLAKSAEDRYQTIHGLKHDLSSFLHDTRDRWHVDSFRLGSWDLPDKLRISQRIYGRDREIKKLIETFNHVKQGSMEFILLAGDAGIGKTALVGELYQPTTLARGYFLSGKFDQLKRDTPYDVLLQAFHTLVLQILTEEEGVIQQWRSRLLGALGTNAQIIIDVIPELELIIGPQPSLSKVAAHEMTNRFNLVFLKFIRVFATQNSPLVLFLDDLQWADTNSLKLVNNLLVSGCPYLMIIGSYRSHEMPESHYLMQVVSDCKKAGRTVETLELQPLKEKHLLQLVCDSLHTHADRVKELCHLIFGRTSGNPFFFKEFFRSLEFNGLLYFDQQTCSWKWDIEHIQQLAPPESVVSFLTNQLTTLPDQTIKVLKLASCIGRRFELQILASCLEESSVEVAKKLWPALKKGFIFPISSNYKLMEIQGDPFVNHIEVVYRFSHDRIQDAVYSQIPECDRAPIHFQIGSYLLKCFNILTSDHISYQNAPIRTDHRIFDLVNQMNASGHPERWVDSLILAMMNKDAAAKARASGAFHSCFQYLKKGIAFLSDDRISDFQDPWLSFYSFCLEIFTMAVEAAYLNDDYLTMNQMAEVVTSRAHSLLDQVAVYETRIHAMMVKNEPLNALKLALSVLELLGMPISEPKTAEESRKVVVETLTSLGERQPEDLLLLPRLDSPEKHAIMRILECMLMPAVVAAPSLLPVCGAKQVELAMKHGNAEPSCLGYVNFALSLASVCNDFDNAYRFGQLGIDLVDKLDAPMMRPQVTSIFVSNLSPWKAHIRDPLPKLLDAYQTGLDTGDFAHAATCLASYAMMGFLGGEGLEEVIDRFRKADECMIRLGQFTYHFWLKIWWQATLNWMGQAEEPCLLVGDIYNEAAFQKMHFDANDQTALFVIDFHKAMLCYHYRKFNKAAALLPRLLNNNQRFGTLGLFANFYSSLIMLTMIPNATPDDAQELLERVLANQVDMKHWADLAPMNNLHKYFLVEAELARIQGNYSLARDFFDKAIENATASRYLNEESFAYEMAARFFLENNQYRLAKHYMDDARYAYERWGAHGKVKDIEMSYPQLMEGRWKVTPDSFGARSSFSIKADNSSLDLSEVLRGSQAIAQELVTSQMLSKVMEVLLGIAGAQKGYLLTNRENTWTLEVEASLASNLEISFPMIRADELMEMPRSVFNYVRNTHRVVVLADATQDGTFNQDAYIERHNIKSLLCLPVLHRGGLVAILFLENNINKGVFTDDRIEILQHLSTQTAISIDNAALYADLEQKVITRTNDLNERNEQILASIRYAKQIQMAILPTHELNRFLPDYFVIYLPRDLVSGDFYWAYQRGTYNFLAVVDCTGHGVPGALMAMIGNTLLDKLIREQGYTSPALILDKLRMGIREILGREEETIMNAGMDVCLCCWETQGNTLCFSGALRPLYHARQTQEGCLLDTIPGSRFSVDPHFKPNSKNFLETTLTIQKGDMIYLTTDGYSDQQDGNRKKFGSAQLKKLLTRHAKDELNLQKDILLNELKAHQGGEPQRDDITIIGLRF